jgi:3-oxoacyl-[acyl-carrier-protein] synthase-3
MSITAQITGVGHYVPERVVTNDDLSKLMSTTDEWITERTGIKERRFVEEGTTTSDIAVYAVDALKANCGDAVLEGVDCIVASTLSPDFYFPGIGTLLQHKLGLGTVPAFDIRAQCSGLVYGLSVVDGLIKSEQYKKILLVCAEVQSPVLELNDNGRDMAVLFGDGAGVLVVEAVEGEAPSATNSARGVLGSLLGSDGSGAELLYLKSPGTATPGFFNEQAFTDGQWHPFMDGRNVFKNAVARMCETAGAILEKYQVPADQVELLLPHQANLRINEMVREKLALPEERTFNNIHKYGNTTAATIPLLMAEASAEGCLKEGMLIMTLAFGAGFTWGANLIRW